VAAVPSAIITTHALDSLCISPAGRSLSRQGMRVRGQLRVFPLSEQALPLAILQRPAPARSRAQADRREGEAELAAKKILELRNLSPLL
jgi:hypothetical protein